MKVLHVIPSVSLKRGGPSFAVRAMTRELARQGVNVEIATTDDDGPQARLAIPLERPICEQGVTIRYFRRETSFYAVSRPLTRWLKSHVRDYDVLHIHALFSYTSVAAGRIAQRDSVPYTVRPLGVLNRWGMEDRRKYLKTLSFRLLDKPVAQNAALVHYTSEAEKREAQMSGISAPSLILPLGLDLSEFSALPPREELWQKWPQLRERQVVLFLSRIDPKKGLDLLLPAFARLRRTDPHALLVIAGEGETSFVQLLRKQVTQLGLGDDVIWAGFVSGHVKSELLATANVYVLPSYLENFGIAAMEAMAAGVPTIISDQVGFAPEVKRYQAGVVVSCKVEALTQALIKLMDNEAEQVLLGENGRRLAHEKYSIEAMGSTLIAQYQQITQAKS